MSDINTQIKKFLEKGGTIKKLSPGVAHNATKNGSICSGSFSSSLVMRAASRNNFIKENKIKKEQKKLRKGKRSHAHRMASEKQEKYMRALGISFKPGKMKLYTAKNLIGQARRAIAEAKKSLSTEDAHLMHLGKDFRVQKNT